MAWFHTFDSLIKTRIPDLTVRSDEGMSQYTSFHIGGSARRMAFPAYEEQIAALWRICRDIEIPMYVIGRGTNLLVPDEGLDCVVIHTSGLNGIKVGENGEIEAGAGAKLAQIAVQAQREGLSGLAFAHGIPGSLGGGILMNAGAYGGEMKQVVRSVRALTSNGIVEFSGDELKFEYRRSVFSDMTAVILSAKLQLEKGDSAAIRAEMDDYMARRKRTQPLEYPSAGSTFKRPEGHYAGALIDECGLRGFSVGGAQVSEKHAGFIINRGGATYGDVKALMEQVAQRVYEHSGVHLEPEVRILGQ